MVADVAVYFKINSGSINEHGMELEKCVFKFEIWVVAASGCLTECSRWSDRAAAGGWGQKFYSSVSGGRTFLRKELKERDEPSRDLDARNSSKPWSRIP